MPSSAGLAFGYDPRDLRISPNEVVGHGNKLRASLRITSEPRDQGEVNCCVSAAVISCFEVHDYYANQDPRPLSVLFNYYYARPSSARDDHRKELMIQSGFRAIKREGLCRQDQHASIINPESAALEPAPESLREEARLYRNRFRPSNGVKLRYRSLRGPDRLERIKALLTKRTAIALGMWLTDAYERLGDQSGSSSRGTHGIPTKDTNSGHAVCCVGYHNRHANPIGFSPGALLIKDSRGLSFGIDGYWWLPYDLFDEIVTHCWFLRYEED